MPRVPTNAELIRLHGAIDIRPEVRRAMTPIATPPNAMYQPQEVVTPEPFPLPVEPKRLVAKPKVTIRELPCLHLGEITQKASCGSCSRKHLHSCDLGLTPPGSAGVAIGGFCQTCTSYVPDLPDHPITQ